MKEPFGVPEDVPAQHTGRLGLEMAQSAWSSQGMFMGLMPEHIPF
jgi:hypothetical protein